LLNFLKPINKTFIRYFNASISKDSTPWAVAIKNNMKGVSPDGSFPLENLQLGAPKYPPFKILEAIYNPFLDQIQVSYAPIKNYKPDEPYPNIGCAALGKYDSEGCIHNFDVRHQLCFQPTGNFYSYFDKYFKDQSFYGFWKEGMLWFIFFDRNDAERQYNPNLNLIKPSPFIPESIVNVFNTSVKENPVPAEAVMWEYVQEEGIWYIDFSLDYSKITLENLENYTMLFWGLHLRDQMYIHEGPYEWNLAAPIKRIEIGPVAFSGSGLTLYAIYNNDGLQASQFNRFYIPNGPDGLRHDIYDQLFNTSYTFPASFVLNNEECGFCGYIDELFSDFIDLYEEGSIQPKTDPYITIQYALSFDNIVNGTVDVENFFRRDNNTYYFFVDQIAVFKPHPNEGYLFSNWMGADAADVHLNEQGAYELLMDKNRSIFPVFSEIPIPIPEFPLTIMNMLNGSTDVNGFIHNDENVFYFQIGTSATLIPQAEPGYVFSAWAGPDAADVVLVEPGVYTLLMDRSRSIYPEFIPN
ncbi:MAG: hypothetical protein PHT69_17200, partial [Bacteroidales bacterium]|nr:hypothetical protein [Bacteroidales bacterium]